MYKTLKIARDCSGAGRALIQPAVTVDQRNRHHKTVGVRVALASLVRCISVVLLTGSMFLNITIMNSHPMETDQRAVYVHMSTANSSCPAAPWQDRATGRPIWVPGFPGSGSELFRAIVPTVTGLAADDIYDDSTGSRGKDSVACSAVRSLTCKTHWPILGKRNPWRSTRLKSMSRSVILLVRNPIHALPSYYNFIWEAEHGDQDHTKQAPEAEWQKWRNEHFKGQVRQWVASISRWLTQPLDEGIKHNIPSRSDYPYFNISLVIPYEELVHPSSGPNLLRDMVSEFRRQSHNIPSTDLDCLWKQQVQDRPRKRREHSYTPGFRRAQKRYLLRQLRENLLQDPAVKQHETLYRILKIYDKDIRKNTRIDD